MTPETGKMDDKRIDELNSRHEWLKKHVSYRAPEAIGLDEFNHAMALVDGYREALRRAALLTPEAVKAICEREGVADWFEDNVYHVEGCGDHEWAVQNTGKRRFTSTACLTVGQLEYAIKQAKENNA